MLPIIAIGYSRSAVAGISDDFSGDMSAWTQHQVVGTTDWAVVTGEAKLDCATRVVTYALHETAAGSDDQEITLDIAYSGSSDSVDVRVFARSTDYTDYDDVYYGMWEARTGTERMDISKYVATVNTNIQRDDTCTVSDPESIKFTVSGGDLTVIVYGPESTSDTTSTTDADLSTGRYCGFGGDTATTNEHVEVDNFVETDL